MADIPRSMHFVSGDDGKFDWPPLCTMRERELSITRYASLGHKPDNFFTDAAITPPHRGRQVVAFGGGGGSGMSQWGAQPSSKYGHIVRLEMINGSFEGSLRGVNPFCHSNRRRAPSLALEVSLRDKTACTTC